MTFQAEPATGVPAATAALARKIFPKGNLYLRLRDELGAVYGDELFADLYATSGGWAASPGRLALVQVMAFMENLSDAQAAEAVRARIDWKYALGLELEDPGFDASVLSEFRQRLLDGQAERRVLNRLLEVLEARGLVQARGRQRTDSTHVLGRARELNRLEMVGETLRRALEALAQVAPDWVRTWLPPAWVDRYAARLDEYRLPKGKAEREALAAAIGRDGYTVLERVAQTPGPAAAWPGGVRALPAVQALYRIWLQQYQGYEAGAVAWRAAADLPAGADLIRSPVDLEVRYSQKRDTEWTGYKVCLTETCDADTPNLIVHVETLPASTPDDGVLADVHADLAADGRLPGEHSVDSGFLNLATLVTSATDYHVQVIGPLRRDTSWQARAGQGFDLTAFAVDWQAQHVTCPQGQRSRSWSTRLDQAGHPETQVQFDRQTCAACLCRAQCTRSPATPRTLKLRSEAYAQAQQAQRAFEATPAFRQRYAARAGIEGTVAQTVARADLRHGRYFGLAKTRLQHLFTAAAVDMVRAVRWLADIPKALTRRSPLVQLFPAPGPAFAL